VPTLPSGLASNYLSVTDNTSKGKVPGHVLEEVRQALAARCHRKAVAAVSAVVRPGALGGGLYKL
jgi:hypothetical protein